MALYAATSDAEGTAAPDFSERAFVRMREILASNQALARRIDELKARLEKKLAYDQIIAAFLSAIR